MKAWRWVALLCFSTVLALLLAKHNFWRDELEAWQIATHADSLSSLFYILRYGGHPALWLLLLRGLSFFFSSPQVMLGVHWLFASLTAFLILWFCPIPAWQRIACCFGYFIVFEFGVICRNYSMGVLLACLFVAVRGRYKHAVMGLAVLLALLVHTSVPGAFLALSLLAYLVTDLWGDGRISRLRLLGAVFVVGCSLAAMASYLKPPADSSFAKLYRENRAHLTTRGALANSLVFLRVAVPLPRVDTLHFWNTNWTDSIMPANARKAIQLLGTALCVTLATLSVLHRRTVVILFLSGTLLIAGFSIIHTQTYLRHQGHWFILLLLCYWIDRMDGDVNVLDFGGWQRKIRQLFPAILFALQPLALIVPIVRSFQAPFSATPALVKTVRDMKVDAGVWSTYPEMLVAPVSALSGRAVYSAQQDSFEYFAWYRLVDPAQTTPPMIASRLAAQTKNRADVLLFLNEDNVPLIVSNLPGDITVRQLAAVPEGILEDEANVALLLQRTQ